MSQQSHNILTTVMANIVVDLRAWPDGKCLATKQHQARCAHDAKLVFSLLTLARYRDLSDLLRSPIVSHVIYCITCTLCNKLYIGETGRRLGDRFREHLRDVEKNDKDASKPVARHFNLPNHSKKHMAICGLYLHQDTTESRKNLEQKFIFQIGTLNPHGINERFSFN